jgi:hypothetical protein
MKTEEECKPNERFLFSSEYFSDNAVAIWKSECLKRCSDKEKGSVYTKYINWTRCENEIAIFTLYAYADVDIPKKFDIIFHLDNPKEFLKVDYELTQCIYEAWFPVDCIARGHKHLCIFKFDKKLPDILNVLHKVEEKFSKSGKEQRILGFCSSIDFGQIAQRIEKTIELKKLYGEKWSQYDEEE